MNHPDATMPESSEHSHAVEEVWRTALLTGKPPPFRERYGIDFKDFRRIMKHVPTDPRCPLCDVPFEGIGGRLTKAILGKEQSRLNPKYCNDCERFASSHRGGAEIELSMLFADVRGSTSLAETKSSLEFSALINRFYKAATYVLVHSDALIEKLIGDQVVGLYVLGIAGEDHARRAVAAAQRLLRVTGHSAPGGPWIPVGASVHTGRAYVGAVGSEGGMTDITALGDAVNTTARLASAAGPGEVLVSEAGYTAANLNVPNLETRRLELKGRAEPVVVRVLHTA